MGNDASEERCAYDCGERRNEAIGGACVEPLTAGSNGFRETISTVCRPMTAWRKEKVRWGNYSP
jgi:hypothetical protein